MPFTWSNWLPRAFRTTQARRTKPYRRPACRPGVELLETRLAPAFDLTISANATVGVTHDAAGNFTATAHGANISVTNIRADLLAGKNVTISDGNTGTEAGNITWQTGADLDYDGIGAGDLRLTVAVDPSAPTGSVAINSRIFDSHPVSPDVLNVGISALKDLTVNAVLSSGAGTVTLAADTKPDGTGVDGVGTLLVGPGGAVTGGTVNLRGAAVNIDTSANPGAVSAVKLNSPFAPVATNPSAVAFDANGNLFIANAGDGTVTRVTTAGRVSVYAAGFTTPEALAFDAAGNLYVADVTANTVSKVTPQGQVSTFASGLNGPDGLAFDTNGNLFIANTGGGTVSKVTPQGQVSTFASNLVSPGGLVFDGQGNLYVTNQGVGSIVKITPNGQTVTTLASGLNFPQGLAIDTQGNLYTSSVIGDTISKVTPDGLTVTTLASGLGGPFGLTFYKGNLYVPDLRVNRVSLVTLQGQVSTLAAGYLDPQGLAFDAAGNLYVANLGNGVVNQVTPQGQSTTFVSNLNQPSGLAFDKAGDLFISDLAAGTVTKFIPGIAGFTFAAGFVLPSGLAIDAAGNVYVANLGAGVINKITPDGQSITTFVSGLNQPQGLAFDAAGNLYISTFGGTIFKVTPDGKTVTTFATGIPSANGLAFDTAGNLYVTSQNSSQIFKVTPQGQVSVYASVRNPIGLAIDSLGNIFVTTAGGSILRVSPGTLTIRSSLPGRPINVGGAANAVAGINLTDAQLARLYAQGVMVFGDTAQTGDITFTTASLAANGVTALQSPVGGGRIVLDDQNGTSAALADGTGNVTLLAGLGGILAASPSNITPEIAATGIVLLDTNGPVGSPANRIQFAAGTPSQIAIGTAFSPSGAFLSGLNSLNLGNILVSNTGTVDVTARTDINVAPGSTIAAGTISLAADLREDGTGDDGHGTLMIAAGDKVTGTHVTLRGAVVNIDASANPATITGTRQVITFATSINAPSGAIFDAAGNLYVANDGDNTVSKITPAGQLSLFASGFSNPQGLAFDAAGNLYVANFGSGTVSKVTPQGQVSLFATGFSGPVGLAFDAAGNLYVANQNTSTVSKVTPQGQISVFATGLSRPEGLAFDANGNLFVANSNNNTVSKVSPDGKTVTPFASGFNAPFLIAFDANGNLYVANQNGNTVSKVTPGGVVSTFASGFHFPNGVAIDAHGTVFVTNQNTNTVSKVTPDGQTITTFASGMNLPEGVAVDAQGNIYVADSPEGTVNKVSPDGKAVTVFASGLQNPTAVAFDAAGNVYIATSGENTIRKFSPDGKTVTVFTQQVTKPNGLAFDAHGNLFVSNDVGGAGAGSVSKVSPDGKTVTPFLASFTNPTGLAFDAQGNLYVLSQSLGTVSKVTPDGKTVTTFASGFNNPYQLAFDPQGYLYVTSPGQNGVFRISPLGTVTTYASGGPISVPAGLAFDAQGNLYESNFGGIGALIRIAPGTVTVRSSVPPVPISLGGTANTATGISLTAAQLARLSATDVLTFGDLAQTGNITLNAVTTSTGLVQVLENPAGPGTIFLDETNGTGLTTNNGDARFTAGTGGVHEVNFAFNTFGLFAGTGAVFFNGSGDVGTSARLLLTQTSRLGTGSLAGNLFFYDSTSVITDGPVNAASATLRLGGDFTTRAGDFPGGPTDLNLASFTGSGIQHLDTGGQSFHNFTMSGSVPLQLANNPLRLTGALNDNTTFDPNGQAVTVSGLTTVNNYLPNTAPESFLGGLLVNGNFQGGSCPIIAGGVTIGLTAILVAPSTTLTDTGDFTNQGGIFDPNGGTVVLAGTNQHVNGSNVFHHLTKTATAADTLTFQAHSTQTVTGVLTLQGTNSQPLQLRSSIPGQPWTLAPQGGLNLNNLNVQDGTDPFFAADSALYTIQSVPSPADVTVQADVALGKIGVQYSGLIARYSGPGATNLYWGALVGSNGQFFADIFRNVGGTWTQLAGASVATGTGALRFDVLGTSLKLYLNDVLVASATDTALTAGASGVRSSPNSGVTNFAASALSLAPVPLPFSDNFNRADGELGSNWLNRLGESTIQGGQVVTHVADVTSSDPDQLLAIATLQGVSQANVAVQADITLGSTGIVYSGLVARYSGPGDTNMYWGGLIGISGAFQAVIYRNLNGVWTQVNAPTPITLASATNTVLFEVVGPSLKLFVNGTLATFATDGLLTAAGTVGLRSGNGVAIDNFSASALTLNTVSLPFTDNFNRTNGELGPNWLDQLGESQVQGNAIVTHVIDPNSQDANKLLAIATLNGVSLADVSLQADVTLGSTGVHYSGLIARYAGPVDQNMYWGGLIGINGTFQAVIYRNVGGVWTQINAPTPITLTSSTNTVRFDVVGPSLKLYVNGTLVTFANDTVLTAAGMVGLRSGNGETIDNFSATAITLNTVSLPFSDNFNRADGQLGPNWLDRLGESQIKGSQVVTSVTDPTSSDPTKLLALATVNGLNAADVALLTDLTLGTTGTTYGGVVARYSGTGDQNMYWAGVVGVNGSFSAVLYVNVNGTWSLLASTAVGSGSGTIKFSVKGTSLTMSFGGKTLTATDSHLTSGTVGLRGGPGVIYDNFSAM